MIEELNADFLENMHGAIVNGFNTFGRQRLGRLVLVDRHAPGYLTVW